MQTILDSEAALVAGGSPKTLTPTFPNGVAGKQGRWRDSIPIRAMAPSVVNEGLGRVRKELGRVRVSAIVPRRRASSSGAYGGETCSSSISFEDDDAVFADRLHSSESGSTACTSEPDAESDDASWGLDGLELVDEAIEVDLGTADDPPFEDDFDDFSLDRPVGLSPPQPFLMPHQSPDLGHDNGSTSSYSSLEPFPPSLVTLPPPPPPLSSSSSPSSQQTKKPRRKLKGTPAPAPSFC